MIVETLLSLNGVGHWLSSCAVFGVVFLTVRSWMGRQSNLPPGPVPVPVLGSLLQVAGKDKIKLFEEFRARYGDVFSFYMGSRLVVVVNGYSKLKETFVTNGNVFSNRPHVFSVDIVGQGKGVVNGSGEVWQEHRKFTFKCLRQFCFGNDSLEIKIREEVQSYFDVLDRFEGQDMDPSDHIQTAIANIICSIAFGERFQYNDPKFKHLLEIFEENMRLVGGMSLLNFFPFIDALPGDMFKMKRILKNIACVQSFLSNIISHETATYDRYNERHFVDAYLKGMAEKKATNKTTTMADDQLLKLVGDLFVGGTETTSTTLRWGLIFLVRHQDVQQKVRDEIDANAGPDVDVNDDADIVMMEDKNSMPFTWATIFEIQRFADIAPLSVAHGLSRDGQIGQFFIPQDALVIPNIHSVHFDPQIFKNPNKFQPDRFINEQGKVNVPREFIPFSLGPRECLGKNVAKMELFIFFASMIKRYLILPPETGELPKMEGVLGVTRTPLPYKIRFVKRSQS
ncbi:cytochrome P450 2B4-like [Gigantopelta aegis]|uniref:cytochrome P450 2B4-like n=1 Tax=Gigantopelta aegis TaxID=1735272 RepID=UPI001B88A93A|nr:cytochrome P450 2B4-like [Gigantopelta aegis]